MTSAPSRHAQALLMLLLTNFFWGLSFPLIKAVGLTHQQLLPGSGTWFVTACTIAPRFLLATAVLVFVLRKKLGTVTRSEAMQGMLLGLTAGVGMLFQNDGLQFTSASVSAFLTQFYAILIPTWLALRSRRWPSGTVLLCGALVLAGVALLGRFDFRTLRFGRGELEALLSSVFFMMQILVLDRKKYAGNRPLPVTLVMFGTAAALFTAMAFGTARHLPDLLVPLSSSPWLAFTLMLAILCTLIPFLFMNTWQPRVTATEAGLIYCTEPLCASAMAMFLPAVFSAYAGLDYANERLTWHLLVGGGLITLANVLIQLKPPRA